MFRNSLIRNSRRFFSQTATHNPAYRVATQKILSTPQSVRPNVHFDVAGTIVDPNCIAPFAIFKEVFANLKFVLTDEQVRGPMGVSKIKHIEILLNEIRDEFYKEHQRYPEAKDVGQIYDDFMLLLPKSVKLRTQLTPGTEEAISYILQLGMKIGLTSGYPSSIVELALKEFKKVTSNYTLTASDQVPDGSRIAMIKANEIILGNASNPVFFTDAPSDIENVRKDKGVWVIGVADYSIAMGITNVDAEKAMTAEKFEHKRHISRQELEKCNPHAVIDNMHQLPFILAAACIANQQGAKPGNTKQLIMEIPQLEQQQKYRLG